MTDDCAGELKSRESVLLGTTVYALGLFFYTCQDLNYGFRYFCASTLI